MTRLKAEYRKYPGDPTGFIRVGDHVWEVNHEPLAPNGLAMYAGLVEDDPDLLKHLNNAEVLAPNDQQVTFIAREAYQQGIEAGCGVLSPLEPGDTFDPTTGDDPNEPTYL